MSVLLFILAASSQPFTRVPDPGRAANSIVHHELCPSWVRGFSCAVRLIEQRDYKHGVQLMAETARAGDTRAMRALGLMLVRGEYVRQDQAQALSWFYEAALRGDRESMGILSTAFEKGIGIEPDPNLAAYWRARSLSAR